MGDDMSVADVAPPSAPMNAVSRRFARIDSFFHNITGFAAFAVFGVLIGVIASLYLGALPSISKFGLAFLWTNAPLWTNTITAVATDNDGLTNVSAGTNVIVDPSVLGLPA